jgi:hypothetical protein
VAFDEHFYKRLKEKVNELGFSESEIEHLMGGVVSKLAAEHTSKRVETAT